MSRPIFLTWAKSTVNYPAGSDAWSNTPIVAAPGADYVTPDTLLPGENFNYVIGKLTDGLTWLGDIQVRNLGVYGGTYNGTPNNGAKPFYDAVTAMWIAGAASSTHGAQKSLDYGRTWVIVATDVDASCDVHAIYADSTGWYVVNQSGGGGMRRSKSTDQGATWSAGNLDAAWAPNHFVQDLIYFNSKFVVIGSDSSNTRIYTSDHTYTSWTHISNPAAINTVTTLWRAAASSTRWLAVTSVAGGKYCTTTDASVFTAAAMSGVDPAWIPKGVCYSNGVFFAVGDDTTNSKVYSSSDGSAWSLIASISGVLFNDINANGTSLVIVENSTGQNPRTYFSVDAGVTWTRTPIQLSTDTTPHMPVRVLANDTQMGIANGTSLNLSVAL